MLPGRPLAWTRDRRSRAVTLPVVAAAAASCCAARRRWQPAGASFLRTSIEDLATDVARVALQLTFLAYQAYEMLHAIGVTLVRLAITQARLLEWETGRGERAARRRARRAARVPDAR